MNVESFFKHWGLNENPFQAEEAKNDPVFHRLMEDHMTHPDFDKIYGSPARPSTSVVFGDKGSGKTAIRILIEKRINDHNASDPSQKVWLVRCDDMNPFIDRLMRSMDTREPNEALKDIKLSDHMDEILSKSVTRLVDFMMGDDLGMGKSAKGMRKKIKRMSRQKRIDFAEMAAIYDQPTRSKPMSRWNKLKMTLRVGQLMNLKVAAWLTMALFATTLGITAMNFMEESLKLKIICGVSGALLLLTAWTWLVQMIRVGGLAKKIHRDVRVVERDPRELSLRLSDIRKTDLTAQPLPTSEDQDSRYELTARLMRILIELDFMSMVVLYDRIDEPMVVNGDPERMKSIIWPMFQNKFLQQEGIGIKMLLPFELSVMLKKESSEFYQHARLDKQNMVDRLVWSGTTLYDICSKRMRGCQGPEPKIEKLTDMFEEDVTSSDVIDALDQMMQPRDAFKFLYKVIQEHCHNSSDEEPQWRIPKHILDSIRKQQSQRVQELYRGMVPA